MANSNICNFRPITNLSTRELNNRFEVIHKHLCFLEGSQGVVAGAANGTSVASGIISIGQDVNAPGDPAALTSQREIPLNNFGVSFIDKSLGSQFLIDFASTAGVSLRYDSTALGTFASIALIDSATNSAWGVENDGSGNIIMNNQTDIVMTIHPNTSVAFNSSISTADPGAGSGSWLLGTAVTSASTLDTTKYLQVKIGSTVYKIATMQ